LVALTFVKLLGVPSVTTKSSTEKLLPTLSLNTKVKVLVPAGAPAVVLAAEVTVAVGATLSVADPPPQALINTDAARAHAERLKVFANEFIEVSPDWEGDMNTPKQKAHS
jgi:hypothetical protein